MSLLSELLVDSPAAYWPLNETSGTVINDHSGNGRHGSVVGSPTLGAAGPAGGRSIDFPNNAASYLSIPDADVFSSASFTINLWVNPDVVNTEQTWISKFPAGTDLNAEWAFWMGGAANPPADVYRAAGGAPYLRYIGPNGTVVASTWQMMTMVIDGVTVSPIEVRQYKNGEFVGFSNSNAGGRSGNGGEPVLIGKKAYTAEPRPMDGRIAHVAFFNSVVPQSRLQVYFRETLRHSVVIG